jgi:hypothetical protein
VKLPVPRARAAGAATACLGLALLAAGCGILSGSSSTSSTPSATTSPAPTQAPANGIADKPPAQIVAAAANALASARSVHMKGTIRESGRRYTFDLVLEQASAKGSMTAPMLGIKNAQFDFVATGGKLFIRSSTLWRKAGGTAAAQLLNNRWVVLPKASVRDFPFRSLRVFARGIRSGSPGKRRRAGAVTMINGRPAIPVRSGDSILYVATTGQPFPLRAMPATHAAGAGVVDFIAYNAPVTIGPPPNAVDLNQLRG